MRQSVFNLLSGLVIFIIIVAVFYLFNSVEGFKSPGPEYLYPDIDPSSPLLSHSVDMPINTTYSCTNFCGPHAECAKTREQCTSDVDCTGCQPKYTPLEKNTHDVRGQNEAGKLTYNQTPRYSVLTTDIGTQAKFATDDSMNAQVPIMYLGYDKWRSAFDMGMELFRKKESVTSDDLKYAPAWVRHTSTTGMFDDISPRAANAYLTNFSRNISN